MAHCFAEKLVQNPTVFVHILETILDRGIEATYSLFRGIGTKYWRKPFTGLPTKDETSETTVQNVYYLFPYFYAFLQLKTCFFMCHI